MPSMQLSDVQSFIFMILILCKHEVLMMTIFTLMILDNRPKLKIACTNVGNIDACCLCAWEINVYAQNYGFKWQHSFT